MSIRDGEECPRCGQPKAENAPGCSDCTKAMPEDIPGAPLWRVTRYRAAALRARSTVERIDGAVTAYLTDGAAA